jgi:hypothetical protein
MYTGDQIVELSRNSLAYKTWDGDDPSPAFAFGIFTTHNWNCAAANIIRDICYKLFDIAYNDDNEYECYLCGDLDDDYCWFDRERNPAWSVMRVGKFDAVLFWFQDMSFVFFVGEGITYFVQWYKSRGRTEWIGVMSGTDMRTIRPVTAQEYADLLNGIGDADNAQSLPDARYEFWYPFRRLDELESQMRR